MAINLMLDRARGETRSAARDGAWRQLSRSELGGIDVSDDPPADEAAASAQRLRQLVAAVGDLAPRWAAPSDCISSRGLATPRPRAPWAFR